MEIWIGVKEECETTDYKSTPNWTKNVFDRRCMGKFWLSENVMMSECIPLRFSEHVIDSRKTLISQQL